MGNVFKPPCDEGFIRSGAPTAPCEKWAAPWILAATILGSSMAFIDGTVVNIALPALQKDLGASVLDVQWVVESYSLFLAALLLVGGSLGDRIGRRLVYAVGVAIFALASLWCGLSASIAQLIVARSIQGIGAALLVPGSLAIISASFTEDARGKAIGTWSGITSITSAIGPALGGWLIEKVSWRAAFFLNLPVAIIVLALIFWCVPESRAEGDQRSIDLWGAALATTGLGSIVYGLIESSGRGFGSRAVLYSLAAGALFFIAFIFLESRLRSPMLPLGIFRSKTFSSANVQTFLLYGALGGGLFFLPLNLIQVQGYSSGVAGAALLPFILIIFALSGWVGSLVARFGFRVPLTYGPFVAAAGFALLGFSGLGKGYWTGFFPGLALLGLGMAVSIAPLTTAIMNSVGTDESGIASGVNNAVSRTAGLLAVAALGVVMVQSFGRQLDQKLAALKPPPEITRAVTEQRARLASIDLPVSADSNIRLAVQESVRESFASGFRLLMLVSAALCAAGGLVGWFSIDDQLVTLDRANGFVRPAQSDL